MITSSMNKKAKKKFETFSLKSFFLNFQKPYMFLRSWHQRSNLLFNGDGFLLLICVCLDNLHHPHVARGIFYKSYKIAILEV